MTVRTVIFDWGGTLTPWHRIDHETLWRDVCVKHYAAARAAKVAGALHAAERDVWAGIERSQESATFTQVIERARVSVPDAVPDAVLASYFEAWEPHTITHPDAPDLLRELRRRNIRIGMRLGPGQLAGVHGAVDQVEHLVADENLVVHGPWPQRVGQHPDPDVPAP